MRISPEVVLENLLWNKSHPYGYQRYLRRDVSYDIQGSNVERCFNNQEADLVAVKWWKGLGQALENKSSQEWYGGAMGGLSVLQGKTDFPCTKGSPC